MLQFVLFRIISHMDIFGRKMATYKLGWFRISSHGNGRQTLRQTYFQI